MKIKRAVIPAAGLGTRMFPISKTVPKEMLSVGQKPIIQYAVEEATDYGIETVVIIINSEKEIIERYFLKEPCLDYISDRAVEHLKFISSKVELIFLYQNQPKGLADAISISMEIIKNEPFALLLPDNILFSDTSSLYILSEVFNKYKRDVSALTKIYPVEFKLFGNSGKVELEKIDGRVYSIKEIKNKERGVFVSNSCDPIIRGFARHILFPHFFDYIERIRSDLNGELDDVPVFQLLLKEKGMIGCLLDGKGYDGGNLLGYQAANEFIQNNVIKPVK
ncbi:MAG: sugar phosphate nucleotidyltransferase [Nitrospinota bacterium]|jgi:UTP--glucose-1-phosphate uridylyltransferase|nr:sugar phosphate nucleotidyltransferase [Nitrospinota bacterium]MDP7581185.1 sugar phosphate nucleotidyltransferase [Nitrospinota bacterium]HJN03138.1 sugar phosphate nucleotidyltransferase [Nitrospinota bacterium]